MKRIIIYCLAVYGLVIGFGIYLNTASGEEGFPYVKHTDPPRHIEPALSCREYLNICEKSCSRRGDLFRFFCLGPDFNPEMEHYRCQCGDDAFQQVAKAEPKK